MTTPQPRKPETLFEIWGYWLAVGFGLGKLPIAPGTWGSLGALGLGWYILQGGGGWPLLTLTIIQVTIFGIWASNIHMRLSGMHDAGEIVIDEVAGQLIAMLPLAFFSLTGDTVYDLIAAFIAFRLFDIWKPWPIGILDRRLKGGMGVMLDDIVAGAFAAFALIIPRLLV